MKIAIMSDCHDQWSNLEKAIDTANQNQCQTLLFAGDLISPQGLPLLEAFQGTVKLVWGNNEAERVIFTRKMDASPKFELCGDIFESEIEKVKIFMNHYPRITELAAASSQFHLCIHGHTHSLRQDKVGDCLLINPGEIQGYKSGQPTFIIFDTQTKNIQLIKL